MSTQPQSRWKRIVTVGAGLVLLIAIGTLLAEELRPTSASSTGPEMRLDITDPPGACSDGACQLPLGATFTLAVEIVTGPPSPGYVAAQSFLQFGTEQQTDLTYTPTTSAADEVVWPDCFSASLQRNQFDNNLPPGSTTDYTVNHGCLTGLLSPVPSTYTGIFVELQFACSAEDSQTEVRQLPYDPDLVNFTTQGTSGSAFGVQQGFLNVLTAPKLTNLTVTCGEPPPTPLPTVTPGGPSPTPTATPTQTPDVTATPTPAIVATATPTITPTPTPTITPTATPTITPTPTPVPRPCGDVNGDGAVNSQDALWVLWLAGGVINFVPFPDDLDGDGVTGPIDALLILQIEANLFICR